MKKKLSFLLLLIGIVGFMYAQETGAVEGIAYLAENGNTLSKVTISIENSSIGTVTDKDGRFSLQSMPVGNYVLVATYIGMESVRKNISVKAGQTTTVNVDLEQQWTNLKDIVIKGEIIRTKNKSLPINTITSDQIKGMNISISSDLLNSVPGVVIGSGVFNGGMSDGFSIRGYGEDAMHAAVNLDGIPLNEYAGHGADGQVDMFVIIPLEIKHMDVFKGPSSVLFGRFANGGAVSFETRRGGDYMDFSLLGGSFGTVDFQTAIGKQIDLKNGKKLRTNLSAQVYSKDGYTENSEVIRGNTSLKLSYDLTDRTEITLSVRQHNSKWNTDSYVREDQFHNKKLRRLPFKFTENDGGNKAFGSERIDLNYSINKNIRMLTFVNTVHEKGTRFFSRSFRGNGRAGQQSDEFNKRNAFLAGTSLNGKSFIGNVKVDWVFGGEYYLTRSERDLDNSVSHRQRIDTTEYKRRYGITPRKPTHSRFLHNTVSMFSEGVFEVSRYFRPSVGVRYDTYFIKFQNVLTDQTYHLNYFDHLSPKFGVSSSIMDGLVLRANVSHGFDIPTSQKINVYIAQDNKLDPSKIWQYELGGNYNYKGIVSFEASGFVLDESNIAYEDSYGDLFNAGKIRRKGVELGTKIDPIPRLHIEGSFSNTKTKIKDNPDIDMVGKEIIAVPHTITRAMVDYHLPTGLGMRFEIRDIGRSAVNESNSIFYKGYTVANAEIYYSLKSKSKNSRLFVQVNNLFNKIYADRTVNFGGDNFYAPAPTIHFLTGLKYSL